MKNYLKQLNTRINKSFAGICIIGLVQVAVAVIVMGIINRSSIAEVYTINSYLYFKSTIMSYSGASLVVGSLVAVLSAAVMTLICIRNNSIIYYIPQGIRRSENVVLNISTAIIVAASVAVLYLISIFMTNIILLSMRSGLMILGSAGVINIQMTLLGIIPVMLFCMSAYFMLTIISKAWKKNRYIGMAVIGTVVVAMIMFFALYLSGDYYKFFDEILFTYEGALVVSSILFVGSIAVYIMMELRSEVAR